MSDPQQAGTGKAEIPEINTRVISLPQKLDELAHELREMEDVSMELSFLAEVARALEEVRTTAESQLRQEREAHAEEKSLHSEARETIRLLWETQARILSCSSDWQMRYVKACEQVAQLQTTISQLREHIANLLGLTQAPLENITDYTVFGDAANIPKGDKNGAG